MFCGFCGQVLDPKAKVCPKCGRSVQDTSNLMVKGYTEPVQQTLQQDEAQTQGKKVRMPRSSKRTNGIGIVGFIYSFFAFLFTAGILFFPGFILSCVGVAMRKECTNGNGSAIAGLVFSLLSIILLAIVVVCIVCAAGVFEGPDWLMSLLSPVTEFIQNLIG